MSDRSVLSRPVEGDRKTSFGEKKMVIAGKRIEPNNIIQRSIFLKIPLSVERKRFISLL
jgi:hypothetical protein